MAFKVEKIHPLDLQPRKAVGVSIPFSAGNVFQQTYTTQEALKMNLINYLLTDKGERYFLPDFGAGLRALLFEQAVTDIEEETKARIVSEVSRWFPTVEINQITVEISADEHILTVYMKYGVTQTNIEDELLINIAQ